MSLTFLQLNFYQGLFPKVQQILQKNIHRKDMISNYRGDVHLPVLNGFSPSCKPSCLLHFLSLSLSLSHHKHASAYWKREDPAFIPHATTRCVYSGSASLSQSNFHHRLIFVYQFYPVLPPSLMFLLVLSGAVAVTTRKGGYRLVGPLTHQW